MVAVWPYEANVENKNTYEMNSNLLGKHPTIQIVSH